MVASCARCIWLAHLCVSCDISHVGSLTQPLQGFASRPKSFSRNVLTQVSRKASPPNPERFSVPGCLRLSEVVSPTLRPKSAQNLTGDKPESLKP